VTQPLCNLRLLCGTVAVAVLSEAFGPCWAPKSDRRPQESDRSSDYTSFSPMKSSLFSSLPPDCFGYQGIGRSNQLLKSLHLADAAGLAEFQCRQRLPLRNNALQLGLRHRYRRLLRSPETAFIDQPCAILRIHRALPPIAESLRGLSLKARTGNNIFMQIILSNDALPNADREQLS
jgi:hypothetical protein